MSHFIMMQYSLKKLLKKYPKKGAEVVIKDMTQLQNWDAMENLSYLSLTSEKKMESLGSLIFLKGKHYG